jgi:outer membrane protein TolC
MPSCKLILCPIFAAQLKKHLGSGLAFFWIAIGAMMIQMPLAGAAEMVPTVNLPSLLQLLENNNPQLKSAQASVQAAQFAIEPARTLDNPTLLFTQGPIPKNPLAWGLSQGMNWSVTQNLQWPGKKQLAGDIAEKQAQSLIHQVETLKLQLKAQLKDAFYTWRYAKRQQSLYAQQFERLEQLKKIIQLRYANQAAAYADYINLQVLQGQIKLMQSGLIAQLNQAKSQIASLIAMPVNGFEMADLIDAPQVTDLPDLPGLQLLALDRNPAFKSSQAAILAASKNLELNELSLRPDFSLTLQFNSAVPPFNIINNNSYGVAVGATVPLWAQWREKNLIAQAQAQLQALRDADDALRQQVMLAVDQAHHQLMQANEQVQISTSRLVEPARVAYRLSLSNYSTNQIGYLDVIAAYTALSNAEISLVQAELSAQIAKDALELAVGNP